MHRPPTPPSVPPTEHEGPNEVSGLIEGTTSRRNAGTAWKGTVSSKSSKQSRRIIPPQVLQAIIATIALLLMGTWVLSSRQAAQSKGAERRKRVAIGDLDFAKPNDLWAIHDLLLVGDTAVFMKDASAGKTQVKEAALDLAGLLPALHPFAPCRAQLAKVLGTSAGQVVQDRPGQEKLLEAAKVSLKCLPGKFSPKDFKSFFTEEAMKDAALAYDDRMPEPLKVNSLGVCAASGWPRTCSYWVALHAMGYRADMLGLSQKLMGAVVPIMAGGATMCGGCTLHFRALTAPLVPKVVRDDLGDVY
mmetsp:Transcript_55163/g.131454  ORF Transcript_55163/g.131454 Transcript_55163/m.131454 type:complete len:303 (-) Transcript_55163:622-1530(-)